MVDLVWAQTDHAGSQRVDKFVHITFFKVYVIILIFHRTVVDLLLHLIFDVQIVGYELKRQPC